MLNPLDFLTLSDQFQVFPSLNQVLSLTNQGNWLNVNLLITIAPIFSGRIFMDATASSGPEGRDFIHQAIESCPLTGSELEESILELIKEAVIQGSKNDILELAPLIGATTSAPDVDTVIAMLEQASRSEPEFAAALATATGTYPEAMRATIGFVRGVVGGTLQITELFETASVGLRDLTVSLENVVTRFERLCEQRSGGEPQA